MGVLLSVDSCFVLPGIDYPKFAYLGTKMPHFTRDETVCQKCSLKGVQGEADDSSGTDTVQFHKRRPMNDTSVLGHTDAVRIDAPSDRH